MNKKMAEMKKPKKLKRSRTVRITLISIIQFIGQLFSKKCLRNTLGHFSLIFQPMTSIDPNACFIMQ